MARSTIFNKEIDLDLAQHIVRGVVRNETKSISIDDIINTVCKHFGLETNAIHTNKKKRSGTSTSSSDVFGKDIHRFLYFENWEIYWKQRSCHRTPRMQNRKRAMRSR